MEHQEVHKIQDLVSDQNFRGKVLNLKPDEKLPQSLLSEFRDSVTDDLEVARQIVVSLEQESELSMGLNKNQIWTDVVKVVDEFDQTEIRSNGKSGLSISKNSFRWKPLMKYAAVFIGFAMAFSWGALYKSSEIKPTEVETRLAAGV